MALRFRKTIKIAPGIRLNIGKKSISTSFGVKGARHTVSSTGNKTNSVSIPGTGISWRKTTNTSGKKQRKELSPSKETTLPKKRIFPFLGIILIILVVIIVLVL